MDQLTSAYGTVIATKRPQFPFPIIHDDDGPSWVSVQAAPHSGSTLTTSSVGRGGIYLVLVTVAGPHPVRYRVT